MSRMQLLEDKLTEGRLAALHDWLDSASRALIQTSPEAWLGRHGECLQH